MGYWTKERCVAEAKKYKTKKEFRKGSISAYNSSLKNKWLDFVCTHMEFNHHSNLKKTKTKWNKKTIFEALKRIKTWNELTHQNQGLMDAIKRLELVNEVRKKYSPRPAKYTKDQLKDIALKYNNKRKFRIEQPSVLRCIYYNGWQDELLFHMNKSCHEDYLSIEKLWLHPQVKNILKYSFVDYSYEKSFYLKGIKVIPDFVLNIDEKVYVVESKTAYQKYSSRKISKQLKSQRKILEKLLNKEVCIILLSEFGTISSKHSDYSLSLEEFVFFVKTGVFKKIVNSYLIKKQFEVQVEIERMFNKNIFVIKQ